MSSYWLSYARVVILLVFTVSFAAKTLTYSMFRASLQSIGLSQSLSQFAAAGVLGSELCVVCSMFLPGSQIGIGFLLTLILLSTFTAVILMRLRDGPTVGGCACFGPAEHRMSYLDVVRNLLLIGCCAAAACLACLGGAAANRWLDPAATVPSAVGVVSGVILINLKDVAQLLRPESE